MTSSARTPIATRTEFADAVRDAFERAAAAGAAEILACDRDFAGWPLSERALVDALTRWAGPRRRLLLIGHTFDDVARRHGRWTEWRRHWSHVVTCRTTETLEATDVPTLLIVPGVCSVRLFDPVRHRGLASTDAQDASACRELFDAVLQQSGAAFPATTLGL